MMADGIQRRARILAIDFGTKRLGLAISDPLGITAQGLPTRERTSLDADLEYLERLVAEHSVQLVIVGNPLSQTGSETAMSQRASLFAGKLRKRLPCGVELWDERMTSVEANRVLRESGMGIEKRRRAADRVAATLILQGYLNYLANQEAGAVGPEVAAAADSRDTALARGDSAQTEDSVAPDDISHRGQARKSRRRPQVG